MGTGGSFLGVELPGHEVDHLAPSSAEVTMHGVWHGAWLKTQ
jgi:hypothetical protein